MQLSILLTPMTPRRSRSQSQSRARLSGVDSQASSVALRHGSAETLVIADDDVGEAVELTGHTHISQRSEFEASSGTLVADVAHTAPIGGSSLEDDHDEVLEEDEEEKLELAERALRPFYMRPSPWWSVDNHLCKATMISICLWDCGLGCWEYFPLWPPQRSRPLPLALKFTQNSHVTQLNQNIDR